MTASGAAANLPSTVAHPENTAQRSDLEHWLIALVIFAMLALPLTDRVLVLFGSGLVLSIYRDKLLSLPDQIRRREGIFRIFDWR